MDDGLVSPEELATFAAIPAPTGREDARLRWLERRLAELPGNRHRDTAGNLIWRFGPDPPTLLFLVHVDTVFQEHVEITITRDGDDLVGPGVGDNAAAVMTTVWALEAMPGIPEGLAVAFTVGEEGLGNLRGALHACAELRPATAIALEGHGLDTIITDHVGSVRAGIEITGPGGHSWWDRGTPSAIHALTSLAANLLDPGDGVNVGTIAGGSAVNAIAAEARMIVERRSTDQAELDEFEARLGRFEVDPPLRLTCTVLGRRGAGHTPPHDALLATVETVRRGLGLSTERGSGSTDANAAAAAGISAIALGCARGSGMHTPDERINLPSIEHGCKMVRALVSAAGSV